MNKRPVIYKQYDPRWAKKPYQVPGEKTTIQKSGCGPTCAAMLIETITGKSFTPEEACAWSLEHGYKALKQGTYYSYFKPQFAAFGISCNQLSWINTYGKPEHENHEMAFSMLKEGYYLIALMGKGQWTSSGHYVVVWWEDGKVRINDPASSKDARENGDLRTFKSQVKYYWWVDARQHNAPEKEDEEMKLYRYVNELPYGKESVTKAIQNGYIKLNPDGSMGLWEPNLQTVIMMDRAGMLDKPAVNDV